MTQEAAGTIGIEVVAHDEIEGHSRLRRIAGACGKLAGLGAISAIAGASSLFFMQTDGALGPHDADVELTLDSAATFDLGPVGSIIMPLEGSQGLGARIEVGEVPANASIDDYARSLATIEDDLEDIKGSMLSHAARNALIAGAGTYALYRFVGKRRLEEHVERMQSRWVMATVASVAAVNLSGAVFVGLSETSGAEESGVLADPIFEGTALENARLTGLLPQVVNDFGKDIIDMWRENDTFYDQVLVNLETAYENQRSLTERDGYPIMLFYTDNHCNVGMARVIGRAAELSGADLVADGGDTTMGGTSYEEFCVQVLANELPDVPRIVAGGNHDSRETERQQEANGFRSLNGEVIEVAGLRILGDDDVMRSEFGSAIRQEGDRTKAQINEALAQTACGDGGVDVLLVHEPDVAAATIAQQCAPTILSGHMHRETIVRNPLDRGDSSFFLTGDNSSGATNDRPTLGPVDEESPARIYLLKFDQERGSVIAYQTVTVFSDARVELSEIEILPVLAP